MSQVVFIIACVVIAAAAFGWRWLRRNKFEKMPFPTEWRAILEANLPVFPKLPEPLKTQLERLVKGFIYSKKFYGCNGLDITDEIRVTIAGQACLLLLNRQTNNYNQLRSILVYPTSFVATRESRSEAGVISKADTGLLGESWSQGKVILSWDDVMKGARNFCDGQNVVLHE